MNIFDELETQYNDIDNEYSTIEFESRSKQWMKKEAKYRRKRELNDQAYFLFMFSRLEERIRNESSALITRKKNSITIWKQRAAWDILPNSPRAELPFKKRLALLTEQGGNDFNLVVEYYKERNSIVHGGSFISPITMPTVISEFKRLYNQIKAR
jgi:hypothetical protein